MANTLPLKTLFAVAPLSVAICNPELVIVIPLNVGWACVP